MAFKGSLKGTKFNHKIIRFSLNQINGHRDTLMNKRDILALKYRLNVALTEMFIRRALPELSKHELPREGIQVAGNQVNSQVVMITGLGGSLRTAE